MKSLSHFENFACFAAHAELCLVARGLVASQVSSPPCDPSTRPPCAARSLIHTNSPQPPPLPPTFNPHRPASAANASGFLLTALSNARAKHSFPCNYAECARPIKH